MGALLPDIAPVLRAWSVDDDMWKRRSAIIAQVRLKGATDFSLLAECIEPNRGDREFFIRKAIGWALRAYAWIDRPWSSRSATPTSSRRCRTARH